MSDNPKTLVSTDWLAAHLKDPDLRVLDASWYLPEMQRDARAEYDAAHIPGARFFDIDDVADHRSDLPHMAPPPEKYMSRMRALGVGDGHQIVAVDTASTNGTYIGDDRVHLVSVDERMRLDLGGVLDLTWHVAN
jgi:thiosulfate/3-mercaptopyruvate sulfurtransferase